MQSAFSGWNLVSWIMRPPPLGHFHIIQIAEVESTSKQRGIVWRGEKMGFQNHYFYIKGKWVQLQSSRLLNILTLKNLIHSTVL